MKKLILVITIMLMSLATVFAQENNYKEGKFETKDVTARSLSMWGWTIAPVVGTSTLALKYNGATMATLTTAGVWTPVSMGTTASATITALTATTGTVTTLGSTTATITNIKATVDSIVTAVISSKLKTPYIWCTGSSGGIFTATDGTYWKLQISNNGTATYVTVTP